MRKDAENDEAGTGLDAEAAPLRRALLRFFHRRLRGASDAEDLAQEVFERIAARDGGEPVQNLGAYVQRVAERVATDRARRRFARRADDHVMFEPQLHEGVEFDPARILAGREDLRRATTALLDLPERTRTVFLLDRVDGMRQREIAVHLGISVSAVEKHMIRAMRHLISSMKDEI